MHNKIAKLLAAAVASKVENDAIGPCVALSAIEAFEFSTVTGASYITNAVFPFSPKPYSKIFGEALESKHTSGMMDQGRVRYSVPELVVKYPFLISGPKYVYPISIENEADYKRILREIETTHPSPKDVVVFRIESWKKGCGLEPFLEYLATVQFSSNGFICENQAPLSATLGSPDFVAFRFADFNLELHEILGVPVGTSIARLNAFFSFPSLRPVTNFPDIGVTDLIIVGEAKVANTDGFKQLDKYISSGFFSGSFFLTDGTRTDPTGRHRVLSTSNFNEPMPIADLSGLSSVGQSPYAYWLEALVISHLLYGLTEQKRNLVLADISDKFGNLDIHNVIRLAGRRFILELMRDAHNK